MDRAQHGTMRWGHRAATPHPTGYAHHSINTEPPIRALHFNKET